MKFYKGKFRPKNPQKYEGDFRNIVYRSMWERQVLKWCDENPQKYLDSWLENIETEGKIDLLLYHYDDYITSTKLSNKAKELLDLMIIVDYDYIAYDDNSYKPEVVSFENDDETGTIFKSIKEIQDILNQFIVHTIKEEEDAKKV
jgi:hypothetical protein